MNQHLRDLLEKANTGELSGAEAIRVVAEARLEVLADQQTFLRDLNAIVAAEAAARRRTHLSTKSQPKSTGKSEPIESYRRMEIHSILLGVHSMGRGKTIGLARYESVVNTVTFIGCTREGIRSMIDKAPRVSP